MPVVNEHAAGIDVGSKEHYVAIGQGLEDVCKFNVYSRDNSLIVKHLQRNNIQTVAMESTGTYWQNLYSALQTAGFEVVLSNNHIKDPQRKTDAKDARWLQKLHSLGLLKAVFIPSEDIIRLRTFHRHRSSILKQSIACVQKMQKALRLMNIRLDVALSDITGVSGMNIIEAIVNGERSGKNLATLVHWKVKKKKEEIEASLDGEWKEEHLFILQDELETYKTCHKRMIECDKQVENLLIKITEEFKSKNVQIEPQALINNVSKKRKQKKNIITYNVSELSNKYFGVDLMSIEGVGESTVMTFITEVGSDIVKFPTKKHFTSWLRLAPNNKITGGKVISSKTLKGKNIMAGAFRLAANTIAQKKEGTLKKIFSRIAFKKGRGAAIVAVARKLAEIFWIMTIKKVPYHPQDEKQYEEQTKKTIIKNILNKIKRHALTESDLKLIGLQTT